MTLPGTRLHTLLLRWCDSLAMKRMFDPALVDLRLEYADAHASGKRAWGWWVWTRGHLALLRLLITYLIQRDIERLHDRAERGGLVRILVIGAAIMFIATVGFAAVPLLGFVPTSHPRFVELAIYMIPQALPLAIPIGLALGIVLGGRGRTMRALLIALALVASLASFSLLAWVVPSSNHAYRVAVFDRPALKGVNELSLSELHQRMTSGSSEPLPLTLPITSREAAIAYHGKWALSVAPLFVAVLGLTLASRLPRRSVSVVAAMLSLVGYWALSPSWGLMLEGPPLPVLIVAWLANAVMVGLALAVASLRESDENTLRV